MSLSSHSAQVAQMLDAIAEDARFTANLTGRAEFSPQVMEAMRTVPRNAFVPDAMVDCAFENRPLPIGNGQTISQPYIVALMTDLLDPQPSHTILEVGTGCGYQAAVLGYLVRRVYSIEIVAALQQTTAQRLQRLGYDNITTRLGDGSLGWPEHAPYDGIIVTAACPEVPPALLEQLRPGGRLIAPQGHPHSTQNLILMKKDLDGHLTTRTVLPVAFVPLTGNTQPGPRPSAPG